MKYYTEDEKVKELKAIYIKMMENDALGAEEPEDLVDPLQASQDKVDAERKRRELANASIKKAETPVRKMDFASKIADLESQVSKKDFAVNFLTKQMELAQDPEDKHGYSELIQDNINAKNILLTQLNNVKDQSNTQSSISSNKMDEPEMNDAGLANVDLLRVGSDF